MEAIPKLHEISLNWVLTGLFPRDVPQKSKDHSSHNLNGSPPWHHGPGQKPEGDAIKVIALKSVIGDHFNGTAPSDFPPEVAPNNLGQHVDSPLVDWIFGLEQPGPWTYIEISALAVRRRRRAAGSTSGAMA